MFAVIKTGGKQYFVSPGQKLKIEKLDAKEDGKIVFDKVFLVWNNKKIDTVRSQTPKASADAPEAYRTSNGTRVGTPLVKGAKVDAKVLKQARARKVIVFKYHSKTRYRKKHGHRQPFTEIEITKIAG